MDASSASRFQLIYQSPYDESYLFKESNTSIIIRCFRCAKQNNYIIFRTTVNKGKMLTMCQECSINYTNMKELTFMVNKLETI